MQLTTIRGFPVEDHTYAAGQLNGLSKTAIAGHNATPQLLNRI
jgi:hypothetical protein